MRVPFKRSKSSKSDVQTEIDPSSKAPISPAQPKDQLGNSGRRRLSKRHHSSASIPTTEQFLDPPVANARPDEPSSRRQLVSRVAVQWRKTTQKKMGLNKKPASQSKRNSQYEAVLYASDSEGELEETAQDQYGGETTRPRDSVVPSEINMKPENDIHDQLDPVMITGEVGNAATSTAKEPEVNITIITENERSNHNDDNESVHSGDSIPPPVVGTAVENEVFKDVENQDAPPAHTPSDHHFHSEISDDHFNQDADFVPPSRTPSPLIFCKRSLPRSRNLNSSHPTNSPQELHSSASSFQDDVAQESTAEADTPCPTRVSILPFVSSGEEAAQVDEINTEEEGDDLGCTSEAVIPLETTHTETETDADIAAVTPLPEDDQIQTASTSGTAPEMSTIVPNTEADTSIQTADDNNDTHDEQHPIQIQVTEIVTLDEDKDGHDESQSMTTDDHENPHETTSPLEPTNTEADTNETNTIKHKPILSSTPLEIPNTPNPRPTTLQATLSCTNDLYPASTGASPTSAYSASGSFPPNSFPPRSISFPEGLPRGTPSEEETPVPVSSDSDDEVSRRRDGPVVLKSVISLTQGTDLCEDSPRCSDNQLSQHGSVRRRRTRREGRDGNGEVEYSHGTQQCITELGVETSKTMPHHDDHEKENKQSWKQWLMKWITGCAGKRK